MFNEACLARASEKDLLEKLESILHFVYIQSQDEALWFHAVTAPEALLQQALRQLHAVIEGKK